jgi:Protein of unknown function DUF2625
MRSLRDLLSDDPAWPLVRCWIDAASNRVEVLEARDPDRSEALEALQVTTRSPMGAIVYETGGLLVDGGWLRVLGSGHPRLPRALPDWNRGRTWKDGDSSPPILVVADDVIGGSFAINGGAIPGTPGHVHYFAPDSLEWESLDRGYSDFLSWTLSGDLERFYEGHRWPGWSAEVQRLPGDRAFSIYPFLWAKGPPIAERSRSVVPMAELFELQFDIRRQLSPVGGDER